MSVQTGNQRIDGVRLWTSLMAMARIGATPKGGVRRLTLTEVDRQGRDHFRALCEAAGLAVRVDAIGNMFARREGHDPSRPPVLFGSHLDSQPSGGKFDGALGVVGGLEVMRSFNDLGIRTEAPLELVNWTNEEGARFGHPMTGSGVWAGVFGLDQARAFTDPLGSGPGAGAGRDRLCRCGAGGGVPGGCLFRAAHRTGSDPGERGQADRHRHRRAGAGLVRRGGDRPGQPCRHHAALARGATRWWRRRGSSRWWTASCARTARTGAARWGNWWCSPNSRNVVPGEVRFSVDLRHPDTDDRVSRSPAGFRARPR